MRKRDAEINSGCPQIEKAGNASPKTGNEQNDYPVLISGEASISLPRNGFRTMGSLKLGMLGVVILNRVSSVQLLRLKQWDPGSVHGRGQMDRKKSKPFRKPCDAIYYKQIFPQSLSSALKQRDPGSVRGQMDRKKSKPFRKPCDANHYNYNTPATAGAFVG
ncbi:hypothetical protein CDAR_25241 [Caerostris darwini]|uniref:Uncharacterized protein n=1 Tax=Caerostris darwini TaxID=1538125 RepID=A0AAV4PCR9_9ARAC|nr:hypothetical protein CDAR_25241 [Caerostris darwini]